MILLIQTNFRTYVFLLTIYFKTFNHRKSKLPGIIRTSCRFTGFVSSPPLLLHWDCLGCVEYDRTRTWQPGKVLCNGETRVKNKNKEPCQKKTRLDSPRVQE